MESTPSQQQAAPEQTQNGSAGTRSQGFPATKIGVFVVVATIIAAGAFFGTQAFLLDDDAADDNRRAVAVLSGTLLDEVTASGSVEFLELESMRFDISGNVGEILVEEGDEVTAGMPLVELDGVTIAALESELAAAEIELENAGEELEELLLSESERLPFAGCSVVCWTPGRCPGSSAFFGFFDRCGRVQIRPKFSRWR